MTARIKLIGAKKLNKQLTKLAKRYRVKGGGAEVGYTANYAIYVHEMVGANFQKAGTQAKFLEQPFRENRAKYVGVIVKHLNRGGDFMAGLLLAALSLQRDSQKICPVDTGNLRASAFTRKIQ